MDKEASERFIEQVFDIWINPEIERRRKAGTLTQEFKFCAAQVLLDTDSGVELRLNSEIKGVAHVKTHQPVATGEWVTADQVSDLADFQLRTDDLEAANAGYVTLIPHPEGFFVAFDFRRNTTRIAEVVRAARDFLNTAYDALHAGRLRPFVEKPFWSS